MSSEFVAILSWEPFSSIEDIKKEIGELESHPATSVHRYMLALPFHFLDVISKEFPSPLLSFGATAMDRVSGGSFTETIAARLLKEAQAQFVLIGTVKNRKFNEEDSISIAKKITAAAAAGIVPVVCVGETLEEYTSGKSQEILTKQLSESLQDCKEQEWKNLQFVYEAPWINATPFLPDLDAINQAYKHCSDLIKNLYASQKTDQNKILCALPNDLKEFTLFLQKVTCDGVYLGKANFNLKLFSDNRFTTEGPG